MIKNKKKDLKVFKISFEKAFQIPSRNKKHFLWILKKSNIKQTICLNCLLLILCYPNEV